MGVVLLTGKPHHRKDMMPGYKLEPGMPTTLPVKDGVRFKGVTGFRAYAIGDDGTIWSCITRGGRRKLGNVWYPMVPNKDHNGYTYVFLFLDGVRYQKYMYRMVLEEFVGPCPPGMQACHDPDRNRANSRLSNLRWGTYSDNAQDAIRHGTRSNRQIRKKLTPESARKIRELIAAGKSSYQVAKEVGVSQATAWGIGSGKLWNKDKATVQQS
jgi:hypothetical protein